MNQEPNKLRVKPTLRLVLTQTEQSGSPRLEPVGSSAGARPSRAAAAQACVPGNNRLCRPRVGHVSVTALICTRKHRQSLIFRTGKRALKVKQLKSEHNHQLLRQNMGGTRLSPQERVCMTSPSALQPRCWVSRGRGRQARRRDCQVAKGDGACREVCEPPCTEWLPQTEKR